MIPRWLRLIERLLLRGADREFVEGDLREEYARRLETRGARHAAAGYLADLLQLQRRRGDTALQVLAGDVGYAGRLLRRRPAFAVTATLTLGLGIGATTAIFSVADAVLLAGLPYRDAERLLFVSSSFPGASGGGDQLSYRDITEIARRSSTLEGIAAYHTSRALEMRGSTQPERIRANLVDPSYLTLLGARAARGRLFGEDDSGAPGTQPHVVVSHDFWTNRLAADPSVVGRQLVLSDVALTVVGVLEPGFHDVSAEEGYSFDSDVFIPARMLGSFGGANLLTESSARNFWALGRVRPGITPAQAHEEIAAIGAALEAEVPNSNRGFTFWAERLDVYLARDIRGPVWLLLGGSCFVLLIACANVANLMLAHVSSRIRELSIRRAIGASRVQVVRLLAAEAAVVALAGGEAGVIVAWIASDVLRNVVPGELTPRLSAAGLNARVLGFSALATAAVAALLTVLAGIRISSGTLLNPMRDSTRSTDVRGARTRRTLLVIEVATAVMLLIGAQLMLDSLARLRASDLGFRTDGLITFEMDLRAARYAEPASVVRFGHQLSQALAEAPGIDAAMLWGPGRPGRNTWVTFPGREDATVSSERLMTWRHTITPGALGALGIPLRAGREFERQDTHDRPGVVIVSETVARTLWPGEEPIGRRLRWRTDLPDSPLLTVVGVAADVKHRGRLNNLLYPARDVYVPHTQRVDRSIVAVVRAAADPTIAVAAVRATIGRLDADLPLFNVRTMAQHLAEEEAETRFGALLMSTYAALALMLAAMGIYGVLSYHVSLRARELAVRMALGARRLDLLRMVVLDGMRPASLGIGLGLSGALVLGKFLRSLLFEVEPNDLSVFVSVAVILSGVALAAALLPAAGATRAEPVHALRAD